MHSVYLHPELKSTPADGIDGKVSIVFVSILLEWDQRQRRRLLVRALADFGRVGWWSLPGNHDESYRIAIYRLDGRHSYFHVTDGERFVGLGNHRELSSWHDQRTTDLEQVSTVASQLRLQYRAITAARRHL